MISGFIVVSSILLALLFGLAWLALPPLRRRIEAPKYAFQEQLQAYNRRARSGADSGEESTDEPD